MPRAIFLSAAAGRPEKPQPPSWISSAHKILVVGMASMISKLLSVKGCVLVLGATGKLGHMLRVLWPRPDDLVLHSRQPRGGFVAFDPLHPPADVVTYLQDVRAVICFSGVTPMSGGDLDLNVDLGVAAVKLAKAVGAPRVFCASSAAVYGRAVGNLVETSVCMPVSHYGQAKLDMEQAALGQATLRDQSVCMLRIGNVAGADAILGGWHDGMELDQFEDATTPARSYIGPRNFAFVLYQLTCVDDLPEVVNLAAPGTVYMGDLLDAASLPWRPRKAGGAVIQSVALSTQRLEQYVSFAAQDSTAEGMVAQWQSLLEMERNLK